MHWGTYKATCRRHGVFRMDWNTEMAEPVFRAVSTEWERVFVSSLAKELAATRAEMLKILKTLHDKIATGLEQEAQIPKGRVRDIRAPQERSAVTKLEQMTGAAREIGQKQQRDISRLIVPAITARMVPGYDKGMHEMGTGSARRRVDIIEKHVDQQKGTMFKDAVEQVGGRIGALLDELSTVLHATSDQILKDMQVNYSVMWEAEAATPQAILARRAMATKLSTYTNQAKSAKHDLLKAHNDLPPPDPDDDDDIQEMKEGGSQEKEMDIVDLLDDDVDIAAIPKARNPKPKSRNPS
ncbi:hypothetical protein T484DRAFT_2738861 [Baffinella frigidus]|nr:hypothetical protein T484DRAFT_2738861 [Cryptophyta sp. CCMP2293]